MAVNDDHQTIGVNISVLAPGVRANGLNPKVFFNSQAFIHHSLQTKAGGYCHST
jgi:hypothetical protein